MKIDPKRVVIHLPHGVGIALLSATWILAPLAKRFTELFIRYEENEDLHLQDEAWNDYLGVLIGLAVTGIILFIALIILILKAAPIIAVRL